MSDEDPLIALQSFHDEVDGAARDLAASHGSRITCHRGCTPCCRDEITVFEIEAARIRREHPELLASGTPHPDGACAFLDGDGACRVYESRPYVCRTQGLPFRWTEPTAEGVVEYRDICPLNDAGAPLETLARDTVWTLGPHEVRLRAIQERHDPDMARVRLRSLFAADPTPEETPS